MTRLSLVFLLVLAIGPTPRAGADPTVATPADTVVLRLPGVVVSATRVPRAAGDLPGVVRVVGAADVIARQPRTPTDALRQVPGVLTQKTSPGQGSPFLRGFTGFRVVHLIDGVRLNNSVFREGPNQYWNLVDAHDARQIEVALGPAAVAYGSDAVGGALQLLGPRAWRDGDTGWTGAVSYRGGTAEHSQLGRVELGYSDAARGGVRAAWTQRDLGLVRGGHDIGRQPYTGYDDFGGEIRGELPLGRGSRLVVAHQEYRQNGVPRTHATIHARSFHGSTLGSDHRRELDQARQLTYLQLQGPTLAGWRFQTGVSRQALGEDELRVRSDLSRRTQGFDVATYGGFAQAEAANAWGRWLLGLEAYHDDVDTESSFDAIQGPVADEATYDLGGAFALHEQRYAGALTVLSGLRFTAARADARRVRDPETGTAISIADRWRAVTGSLRAGWFPGAGATGVFAGVSQAFRAPNLSDLSRFDLARTSEIEVPSPGLDPEHFVCAELGFRAGRRSLDFELTGFRTWIRDLIVRRPTGSIVDGNTEVSRANAGDGYVVGFESTARWSFARGWTARGRVAWQEGELDQFPTAAPASVREPLSRVLPWTGAVQLGWRSSRRPLEVEAEVEAADRADRLSSEDRRDTSRIPPGGTPGYVLGHLRAHYRALERIDFTLAVENVGDADYRVHGSGSNEAGRNFVLGVRVAY